MATTRARRVFHITMWLHILIYVSLFGSIANAAPGSCRPRTTDEFRPGCSPVAGAVGDTAISLEVDLSETQSSDCVQLTVDPKTVYAESTLVSSFERSNMEDIVHDHLPIDRIQQSSTGTVADGRAQQSTTGLMTAEKKMLPLMVRYGTRCFDRGRYCVPTDLPCYKAWADANCEYQRGCEESEELCLGEEAPQILGFCEEGDRIP